MLLTLLIEKLSGLLTLNILREWFFELFFEFFHHRNPSPWRGEINFQLFFRLGGVCVYFYFIWASQLHDHLWEHVFSQLKQIFIVSIGHIEFTTGVFWVVSLINRLISEVLANLEDSIQTAHYQLFQIKFRSYSHVEFHVQIIMMSHERSGSSTTWNHVHHRSLHFQKV